MAPYVLSPEILKQDDLVDVIEWIEDTIPGIKFVRDQDKNFVLGKQLQDHSENFAISIIDQISEYVRRDERFNIKICVPLNGGLLAYWEVLKKLSSKLHLLQNIEFVFAAKNGKGKDQYEFNSGALEGPYNVFLLIDDIYDKGGSSENILSQTNPRDHARGEFLSTKEGRGHKQFAPIFVFEDQWVTAGFCMNSSLGDPRLYTNPHLISRSAEIEKLERLGGVPLLQMDIDAVNSWSEYQVQFYIDLLKNTSMYNINSQEYKNFKFLIDLFHKDFGYEEKLSLAEKLDKALKFLIQQGYHLDQFPVENFFEG